LGLLKPIQTHEELMSG